MISENPTLPEYWEALKRHDWFYEYSDDGRVYHAGSAAQARLRRLAGLTPEHQALFDAWHAHVFSGKPWGTEKLPEPTRPAE